MKILLLALPARFWKWRMQGGSLTLAEQARALPSCPDLILASDMLNMPAFLGLTRDFLSGVPVALYCHENQLTYSLPPSSPLVGGKEEGEKRDLNYGMINWLSMLAADQVFFNSRYHLEDWFEELSRLLKHFPDHTHVHRIAEVRAKAGILPVGCDWPIPTKPASWLANSAPPSPASIGRRWGRATTRRCRRYRLTADH